MNTETYEQLIRAVEPQSTAVVVVDVQNDFCAEDGYFAKTGVDVSTLHPAVERMVGFLDRARSAGVKVVFVRSDYTPVYLSEVHNARRKRLGWDFPYCLPGTWGADFYRVAPEPGEVIVTKHRYDGFYQTDLELVLRTMKIKNLLFMGVTTDVCVETTLRSAYVRDFQCVLVEDCCAARDQLVHESALETLGRHFCLITSTETIAEIWDGTDTSMNNVDPQQGARQGQQV